MFLMTKAGTVHIVQIVCLGWSSGLRAKCKFVTYCCIRVLIIKTYRGFSPYATFGTWQKVALAKNRISHVCTQ